jgi:hypothetical protein
MRTLRLALMIVLAFSARGASAAVSVVQSATHHSAGSLIDVVTLAAGTSAGNLLAIGCVGDKIGGGQPAISTVIDDKLQHWVAATAAKAQETTRFYTTEIWLFKNTVASATIITVTWTGAQSDTDCWALEISGASITVPQDGNGSVLSNQSTANPVTPTITTTNNNDIILEVIAEQHGMTGGGNNGYTLLSLDGAPNDYAGAASYKIFTSTCTCTGDSFTAAAGAWISSAVAFTDGAGSGGATPCYRSLLGVGCLP